MGLTNDCCSNDLSGLRRSHFQESERSSGYHDPQFTLAGQIGAFYDGIPVWTVVNALLTMNKQFGDNFGG
jgi:hypothetical protein